MNTKLRKLILILGLACVVVGSISAQDTTFVTETSTQLQGIAGEFWQRIQNASQNSILQLMLIIGGTILIFIGWRIYNFVIFIAGTLTGALLASALITTSNAMINLIIMLVGGAIGGFIAIFLYYIAVFAIGAYVGVILTFQLITALNLQFDPLYAAILGAVIGGLILVGLSFELLVIISSIVGGQLLSLGLGLNSWWTIGFIAFGIIWQITLAKVIGYKVRRRPTRRMLFRDA